MIELFLILIIITLTISAVFIYKAPRKKDIDKMLSNAYHKGFEDGFDKANEQVKTIEKSKIFDESITAARLNNLAKKQKKPKKKR